MVWTSPMTFVSGKVLTAAQLNTFLRDNMLETDVGRATTSGSYFIGVSNGVVGERLPTTNRIDTAESTTNTEFGDLDTVGPKVTVTTSTNAMVFVASQMGNTTANAATMAHFSIEGATSREPKAYQQGCLVGDGTAASSNIRFATYAYLTDLTPGENIFTMKYKVKGGTGTFNRRILTVLPM